MVVLIILTFVLFYIPNFNQTIKAIKFIVLMIEASILAQKVIFPALNLNGYIVRSITSYSLREQSNNQEVRKEINHSLELFLQTIKFDGASKGGVRNLVKIVGCLEIIFFSILTLCALVKYRHFNFEELKIAIGAWLTLKVIGNYKQWSDAILGRAIFYVFLLGTMINLILGILVGIMTNMFF